MNIYVPHNRNVAPSGLDNVYGMDMYLDEIEDFVKSFLTIHKDGKFLCHNPFLLDFLPKDSLIYILMKRETSRNLVKEKQVSGI